MVSKGARADFRRTKAEEEEQRQPYYVTVYWCATPQTPQEEESDTRHGATD